MKNSSTYHRITAVVLVLSVLQVTLLKDVHLLLESFHYHAERCFTYQGEKHLHSEAYSLHQCSFCLLHISPTTVPDAPGPSCVEAPYYINHHCSFSQVASQPSAWHFRLRGPPGSLS